MAHTGSESCPIATYTQLDGPYLVRFSWSPWTDTVGHPKETVYRT